MTTTAMTRNSRITSGHVGDFIVYTFWAMKTTLQNFPEPLWCSLHFHGKDVCWQFCTTTFRLVKGQWWSFGRHWSQLVQPCHSPMFWVQFSCAKSTNWPFSNTIPWNKWKESLTRRIARCKLYKSQSMTLRNPFTDTTTGTMFSLLPFSVRSGLLLFSKWCKTTETTTTLCITGNTFLICRLASLGVALGFEHLFFDPLLTLILGNTSFYRVRGFFYDFRLGERFKEIE